MKKLAVLCLFACLCVSAHAANAERIIENAVTEMAKDRPQVAARIVRVADLMLASETANDLVWIAYAHKEVAGRCKWQTLDNEHRSVLAELCGNIVRGYERAQATGRSDLLEQIRLRDAATIIKTTAKQYLP